MDKLAQDALTLLTPQGRVELVKKNISLPAGIEYSIVPCEDPLKIEFHYYGKKTTVPVSAIFTGGLRFSDTLAARIVDAQMDAESMEVVFEETDGNTQVESYREMIKEMVGKAKDEDELAEIFNRDLSAFREFYNSPDRRSLCPDTRSFLLEVINNPFIDIWS